ncbi:hypothetical protein PG996_010151 [Apiospora saccharicola]|uniref:DUF7053 domain-containing protein n=1 Tax=Apiospora saccharicola TaxID=335842 RepID=A0ABR1UMT6_9PEZI
MSKRTTFTNVTPLPAGISRAAALSYLHDHEAMIDLNPLVVERHRLDAPPPHAPEDECAAGCSWWSMTDSITYLPGIKGELTYSAAFLDLRDGLQTHVYAPMGTDIRNRWTLGGTLPGEPPEPQELGLGAPRQGLYIREDVELRCNFLMASFVRKTLSKAHTKVIENIAERAKAQMGGSEDPTADGVGGAGTAATADDVDDGVYGQGQDDQQQVAGTRRRNAANLNLEPVYGGHRAAASETDLSPTSLSPNSLAPAQTPGPWNHTHQDSWSSTGGWPLQPPHPHGRQDQGRDRQQGSSLSRTTLVDDGSILQQHNRSQSLSHPRMAELQ